MCPTGYGHCSICCEMHRVFFELQEAYLFQRNLICRSASQEMSLQLLLWPVFNRNINKYNTSLKIEIAKSVPHIGIFTNYWQTC